MESLLCRMAFIEKRRIVYLLVAAQSADQVEAASSSSSSSWMNEGHVVAGQESRVNKGKNVFSGRSAHRTVIKMQM